MFCTEVYCVAAMVSLAPLFPAVTACTDECKHSHSILGMMLKRHIIKSMRTPSSLSCLRACYENDKCQSFNYVMLQDICELNNETREAKPEYFAPSPERYYITAKDVDECAQGTYDCLPGVASCINTFGSYRCACNYGYVGDGKTNCEPIVAVSHSCYDSFTVRSDRSGMIYSNKYGHYTNMMTCYWIIFSPGAKLKLTFFRFDTESNYDYVYVYNGDSQSAPLLGKYHGTTLPGTITSSYNHLYVLFTSDMSSTRSGFAASYRVVESIRLIGGTPLAGRLDIFYNKKWSTVCGDSWDRNDAEVVCRQLGFPPASKSFYNSTYGKETGRMLITNVGCLGTEAKITDCSLHGLGIQGCSQSQDVSVECSSRIP